MSALSRRSFIGLLGAGSMSAVATLKPQDSDSLFRVRTITAGVELGAPTDIDTLRSATRFLGLAKARFAESLEVQTTRISTQPLPRYLPGWLSTEGVEAVRRLDEFASAAEVVVSVGPVLTEDADAPGFASWATDLLQATASTSFSSFMASAEHGIHRRSIGAAAEAISAIAQATPGGEGNFRYSATAFCPPGTPFFPASYHEGPRAFSIGLETPRLLFAALEGTSTMREAEQAMLASLNAALKPVERLAEQIALETGWRYLGIDTSPAPALDASIGQVIEGIAGAPFGSPSTLSACSTITSVLQGLDAKTCGYSGLMLPVLEDRVLAKRAVEDRYGVPELLLYSSVCGTGLDVVPLAGDVPVSALAATIGDVAALSTRYRKSLAARLFPVPGKAVGDPVDFDSPYLTRCVVMPLD
jgi:uncharacterized protein (UPF0210 family)